MNEDDWSSIEQVPVYTEKELANEFEAFSTTLNGTSKIIQVNRIFTEYV